MQVSNFIQFKCGYLKTVINFVTGSVFGHLGAVSRKPRKLFGPVKPLQNLKPCEYRAVLFTYSKDEGRFPSYKKTSPFLDTDDLKMALRARKLSGAFEKRAPGPSCSDWIMLSIG